MLDYINHKRTKLIKRQYFLFMVQVICKMLIIIGVIIILALTFPTFCYGSYAQDQGPRGKVVDYALPIEIGGVRIRPGDILFGDRDGVVVIPREAETEAVTLALEKATTENKVRVAIQNSMSTVDAFEKFGVM